MLTPADNTWTLAEAAHLLNRAGFGGTPADIKTLHALGRTKAVASLLSPDESVSAFPPPAWTSEEQALADMRMRAQQFQEARRNRRDETPGEAERMRREAARALQQENRERALEAQAWWFRRMLNTRAPLREKMTLFWHDHFASSIQKVRQTALMVWQNQLFRQHAYGSFRELTHAILMDPAMMFYLDTQNSRAGKPNENFAREVMELFTLGEGNYTEQDIREAARAFTGYQINRLNGQVIHNRRQWDSSDKTVFGRTGPFDGREVIDILFAQPAAARLVPSKLWEFFVAENPPAPVIAALAETFRAADFRVEPVLRRIFLSQEFYAAPVIRDQIKSPVQYLVALLKQLGITAPPTGFPITAQQQLGQVLFMPPNVAGWDWGKAWINTNTLLTRYNLAGVLTKGAGDVPPGMRQGQGKDRRMDRGARQMNRGWNGPNYKTIVPADLRGNPETLVDTLINRFFQGPISNKHRATFIEYAATKTDAGLTDPELAELCHLILSTPEYQLC